jgi:hypothetical protein
MSKEFMLWCSMKSSAAGCVNRGRLINHFSALASFMGLHLC